MVTESPPRGEGCGPKGRIWRVVVVDVAQVVISVVSVFARSTVARRRRWSRAYRHRLDLDVIAVRVAFVRG